MRMLLNVEFPAEPFNTAVKNGTVGAIIGKIMEDIKPEAAYFTDNNGHRGGVLVVNVDKPSDVPFLAEPWFLKFNAECQFHIAMTPDDLRLADLEELGKKWS